MKQIVGLFLFLIGILLAVYVGVWVLFIGGIIGLINAVSLAIDGGGIDTVLVSWSIVKIIFSGLGGYLTLIAFIIPSMVLLEGNRPVKFRLGGVRYGNRFKK